MTDLTRASLKNHPREWVEAEGTLDRQSFPALGVRLKGTTSFMPLEQKPSLTLDFTKARGHGLRRFAGLGRIHLNNDRIYFEPGTGKAILVVHGLDRMWEQPEWPVPIRGPALFAKSVLATPEGRRKYEARLKETTVVLFRPEWISHEISNVVRALAPFDPHVPSGARSLEKRMLARLRFVKERLTSDP